MNTPNSKVHGANMGPIWGQDSGGPHVGPMNFAIWDRLLPCQASNTVAECLLSEKSSFCRCISVTWFHKGWPSDATWRHKSVSTLVQVVAYCLTPTSHFLGQCLVPFCETIWHTPESNLALIVQATILHNEIEIHANNLLPHLPGENESNSSS